MNALTLNIDLPFLAGEINEAHRQVTYHAKGMLLEAKRAGDALLTAKAKVKHGEFEGWVKGNCRVSVREAQRYMKVSKLWKNDTPVAFDGSLTAFLEAHAKPRVTPPSATPSFTTEDAERVLNIAARVERGEGAEKAVAASKLSQVAEKLGTTPEAILERSKAMCPDRGKSSSVIADEAERDEKVQETEARIADIEAQIDAFKKREALISELLDKSKEELAEMLADRILGNCSDH